MLIVDPIGLKDNFHDDYFEKRVWPISEDEYRQVFGGVMDLLLRQVADIDPASADVLVADNRFVLVLLSLIHTNAATNLGKDKWGGVCPEVSIEALQEAQEKDIYLGTFKSGRWLGLKSFIQAIYRAGKYSRVFNQSGFGEEVKMWFKSLSFFMNSRRNSQKAKKKMPTSRAEICLGNPAAALRKEYLKGETKRLLWVEDLVHWHVKRRITKRELSSQIRESVEALFDEIRKMPDAYIRNIDLTYFEKAWKTRLGILWNLYWAYRSEVPDQIGALHVVGSGNTTRRLLSLAWQREGVKVFAYNHGGNLHLATQYYYFLQQEAIWGNLVCPNKAIAHNMGQAYSKLTLGANFGRPRHLFPTGVDLDKSSILKSKSVSSLSRASPKLLLVGFPMHAKRYLDGDGLFFHFRFDLELRIITYLVSAGYDISYKIHPEYTGRIDPILIKKGIDVVSGPFEDVWSEYDSYLFTDTPTAPFGFALTTDKPIILTLLDQGGLSAEAFEALACRASIVPLSWSNHNRLMFNEADMATAIKTSQRKSADTSFWERYVRYQWHYTPGWADS